MFALSDALAITPALPVAFVFARRRRPIALLSLPARPSPCRSPALVAAIALSCPPGMKTLLASFQQTAARPRAPACALPPAGLLIFRRACRILNRAHGSVAPGSSCLGGESIPLRGAACPVQLKFKTLSQGSTPDRTRFSLISPGTARARFFRPHAEIPLPSSLWIPCQLRLKTLPILPGRKFPSPVRWWFTVSADGWKMETGW